MNNNLKEILSCILIVCTVNLIVNLSFIKNVNANNIEEVVAKKATPILIASGGNPTPTPIPEPPFWYDCTTSCIVDAVYYDIGPDAASCVAAVYSNVGVLIAILGCLAGTAILGNIACLTAPAVAGCGPNAGVGVTSSAYSCAFWCYWYS